MTAGSEMLRKIPITYIIARAKEIHAELLENTKRSPEFIDFPLLKEAENIHFYLFGSAPSAIFKNYVQAVREHTKQDSLLAGWPGVTYPEKTKNSL